MFCCVQCLWFHPCLLNNWANTVRALVMFTPWMFMPAKCHHARCSPPISNTASQIKREPKPILESWHTIVICTYLIICRYIHEPKKTHQENHICHHLVNAKLYKTPTNNIQDTSDIQTGMLWTQTKSTSHPNRNLFSKVDDMVILTTCFRWK